MTTQQTSLTVLDAACNPSAEMPWPKEMPENLRAGDILGIPDTEGGVTKWYIWCDLSRWWSNGKWNQSGTIMPFEPSGEEGEFYKLRLSLLKRFGWVA